MKLWITALFLLIGSYQNAYSQFSVTEIDAEKLYDEMPYLRKIDTTYSSSEKFTPISDSILLGEWTPRYLISSDVLAYQFVEPHRPKILKQPTYIFQTTTNEKTFRFSIQVNPNHIEVEDKMQCKIFKANESAMVCRWSNNGIFEILFRDFKGS